MYTTPPLLALMPALLPTLMQRLSTRLPWLAMVLGLALMALLAHGPAQAGGLSVLPTRIDLAAGRAVQSVLLTNTSAQAVTVETQVLNWPEDATGQQANDIVVTPAVVTLPPNQRMRVRIGLLRTTAGVQERAYRLYFTELQAPAPLVGSGIGVLLRVGIPVFVAPEAAKPQPLVWSMSPSPAGWNLLARNDGNVHTTISHVKLVAESPDTPLPPLPVELPSPHVLAGRLMTVALGGPPPKARSWRVRYMDGEDERDSVVTLP